MSVISSLFTPNVKPHFKPFKASDSYQTHTAVHALVSGLMLSSFPLGWLLQQQQKKKKPASSTTLQLRSQGLLHEILCITEAWWVEEKRSDRQGWDFHSCSTGTSAVIPPAVQTVTPLIRGCHVLNGREATLWNILHSSSISRSVPCRVLEIGAYRKWRSGLN